MPQKYPPPPFIVPILWSGARARHCSHSKFLGKRRLHYRDGTHPDNSVVSLTFSERAAQSVGADEAPGAAARLARHVSVRMIRAQPAQIPYRHLSHPPALPCDKVEFRDVVALKTRANHNFRIVGAPHAEAEGTSWTARRKQRRRSKSLHHHQCSWTSCASRSFVQHAAEDPCHRSDVPIPTLTYFIRH